MSRKDRVEVTALQRLYASTPLEIAAFSAHRADLVDKREPSGLSSGCRETEHLSFAIRQESLHNPLLTRSRPLE